MIIFIIGLLLALVAALIYIASLLDERESFRRPNSSLKKLDPSHNEPDPSIRPCGQGHIPVDDWS